MSDTKFLWTDYYDYSECRNATDNATVASIKVWGIFKDVWHAHVRGEKIGKYASRSNAKRACKQRLAKDHKE